jgi:hypothetical protein
MLPSQNQAGEIFRFPIYASDGGAWPVSGGAPFLRLGSAYPSKNFRGGRQRRTVSARKLPRPYNVRKRVTRSLDRCAKATPNKDAHTASLNKLAEPIYYNKRREHPSTSLVASQRTYPESLLWRAQFRSAGRVSLLIPATALTLTVFRTTGLSSFKTSFKIRSSNKFQG